MKQTIITFVLLLLSLSCASSISAIPVDNGNELVMSRKGRNREDMPKKGNRIPSAPIHCIINYEDENILGNFDSEIESYEMWDEDGEIQYCSIGDCKEFIEFLSSAHGCFQLRFITDEYVYIGFIEK